MSSYKLKRIRLKPALCAALCALSFSANFAHAQDEESELLEALSEETEIASRSKQNADFVPGLVSVLQGDELALLGKRTVLDALTLVPGIEANVDLDGNATLRVRGFDFFFNSGNVKVMVDGLDMAAETSASNSAVLLMPIAQVDRIEVIRGPGSNLYGDFAFTGLVNIITRSDRSQLSLAAGSEQNRQLAVNHSVQGQAGQLDFNASDFRGDIAEDSALPSDEEQRRFVNARWSFAGFVLQGNFFNHDIGREAAPRPPPPPPGQAPPPPPPPRPRDRHEILSNLQLQKSWQLDNSAQLGFSLGRQNVDSQFGNSRYDGHEWRYSFNGEKRFGPQLWLFEVSRIQQSIDFADSPAAMPQPGQPANPNVRVEDISRSLSSVMLQDQIDFNPRLSATLGVRLDELQGVDSKVTPRAAVVWRINDRHTFKAQTARGFRTPTFIELYSAGTGIANGNLDFETIQTSELAYIYDFGAGKLRAAVFNASVPDAIFRRPPGSPPGHQNAPGQKSKGVELEYQHELSETLQVRANFSFADTADPRIQMGQRRGESFGAAKNNSSLSALWRAHERWQFGAHLLHVGTRQVEADQVAGYNRLDLALTHRLSTPLSLRVSVQNATDAELRYITRVPPGRRVDTVFSERLVWAELLWEW